MTILLLMLLVVYFAAVSAPFSMRLVGLILIAQRTPRAAAARGIDDSPFRDAQKRHQCSP